MSESERSSKKKPGERFAELGPTWIAAIAALIVALTGAGFFAGRATGASSTPQPNIITKTVTVTASAPTAAASSPGSTPTASPAVSGPPAADGPITGDWNVTYAATATVTITLAGGVYTEFAKTQVLVFPGANCYIQPGTAIATFSQTGPGTYAGHARLWSENTCTTGATTSMRLALSSDGNRLVASLEQVTPGTPSTMILTRI